MKNSFCEIKLFQVKPDKFNEFEKFIIGIIDKQNQQLGCISIKYMKRFYTIDGIELGNPPRELTKIVKCVKYFSYWEFDNKENYGKTNECLFHHPSNVSSLENGNLVFI